MCDALSRNTCGDFVSTLANCLSHGRREFVGLAPALPAEVRHVLEEIREIYRVDAKAKELELTAARWLGFHQTHSQPVMDRLALWMKEQLDHKKVEPNSGLGQAINYMLNHWEPLTLFLRKAASAPGRS